MKDEKKVENELSEKVRDVINRGIKIIPDSEKIDISLNK